MLRLQFFAALVVAAVADGFRKAREIRDALKTKAQVPKELAEARMAVCRQCPVFAPLLATCGSPLRASPVIGFDGCLCHCPTLCSTAVNCTAFDFYEGNTLLGWPRELNSFPDVYE